MSEKCVNLKNNYIQINLWGNPEATVCDLGELLTAIEKKEGAVLVCSIDRIAQDLQDENYLSSVDVSQETKEYLFNIISEYA